MIPNFLRDGAERHKSALTKSELAQLKDLHERFLGRGPGTRIANDAALSSLLKSGGSMDNLAKSKLGNRARPVRALLFDKRSDSNWSLGWHQDRTIAVRTKIDCSGFGPWTVKGGITHVEPPFNFIEGMVTLRAHLDPCDSDNAPLLIAPGSHRLGRIPVDKIADSVEHLKSYACLAEAGDIWIYATAIVHASDAAQRPSHRRVLHVDYSDASLPDGLEWYGL